MNRAKDFADDLGAISANVEQEVGRYVRLLRHETTTGARSPETKQGTKKDAPQEMKSGDFAADEDAATPPAETRLRTPGKPRHKIPLAEQIILENVTTRLHRETNERLTEAALRQKLKKQTPATRQDIVEEALREWFRKQGYAG